MKFAVELVVSAASPSQFPKEELPQVAFCGRSNVGKSSLINAMVNRRNLARTSSTPGKTRQLNFYRLSRTGQLAQSFYFVDLPGYGYAKVSRAERDQWRRLVEAYFQKSRNLRAAISIIDCRIGPTASDLELLAWLSSFGLPIILTATKADKLSNKKRAEMLRQITATVSPLAIAGLIAFSAVTGMGRKELWKQLIEVAVL